MATIKSINPPASGVADPREAYEALGGKILQLHALLEMTYGAASETFNDMSADLRGNYLWACSDMAEDCHKLAESLGAVVYGRSGTSHV